jgi:tetratricopeptide (TPR) repeat protein
MTLRPWMMTIAVVTMAGILVTPGPARGQQPAQNGTERFDMKVREDFYAGFNGDPARLDRAMKTCEDALAADPKNSLALAWHGGGLLFMAAQASRAGDQKQGNDLNDRALHEMQSAVDQSPDDISVLITRGASLQAQARHPRNQQEVEQLMRLALSDYEHTRELQSAYLDRMFVHARGELLLGLADGYSRVGETDRAASLFEKIRRDLPDTPYASSADLWLQTKSPLPVARTGCFGCHVGK